MSDPTVDRLTRMLDEEREGHRREREHVAKLAQRLHSSDLALHNANASMRETMLHIEKLESWIDNLYRQVPEKDRKKLGKRPAKFDDVPF